MIEETLHRIQARIEQSAAFSPDAKAELLQLISQLKAELSDLSKRHPEQAESLARQIELSTRPNRPGKESPRLQHAFDELSSTVASFEKEHPQLVNLINRVSTTLANMGI